MNGSLQGFGAEIWIPAAASIVSALLASGVSLAIYLLGFKKDIKKIERVWEHEGKTDYQNRYIKMVTKVFYYLSTDGEPPRLEALESIIELRAIEKGNNASILENLHSAVLSEDKQSARMILDYILDGGFKPYHEHS